jgi:hypothetical protein
MGPERSGTNMIWEYKIVYFGLETAPPKSMEEDEYEERILSGEEMLNELGKEGWELVTFISHITSSHINKSHAVMKRWKTA